MLEIKQGEASIVTYAYDYQGRRVRKTVNGGDTTRFCYDGDQIIADYNEAGVWKRRYYYGPGIDEPICMARYPGALSFVNYYYYDGLGSVVAMSDYGGRVVEKYSYDVFGKPTIYDINNSVVSVSSVANRYLFTGREYDSETGNYYYRARYYHPAIGRFMQADPDYYKDNLNLYIYARNNPIMRLDPTGRISWGGITNRKTCLQWCGENKESLLDSAEKVKDFLLDAAKKQLSDCINLANKIECDRVARDAAKLLCLANYGTQSILINIGYGNSLVDIQAWYAGCTGGCYISFKK